MSHVYIHTCPLCLVSRQYLSYNIKTSWHSGWVLANTLFCRSALLFFFASLLFLLLVWKLPVFSSYVINIVWSELRKTKFFSTGWTVSCKGQFNHKEVELAPPLCRTKVVSAWVFPDGVLSWPLSDELQSSSSFIQCNHHFTDTLDLAWGKNWQILRIFLQMKRMHLSSKGHFLSWLGIFPMCFTFLRTNKGYQAPFSDSQFICFVSAMVGTLC